ncbi:MAG: YjjG family noncanonical pyrimidine nucleotidase [Muribaculaceae bacterium]|nr:YjjG family noncanonical pyrimidine nucleotidase [Muribaculaceae bacterium]
MRFSRETIDWVWVDLDDTVWDFKGNSWESLGYVYHAANLDSKIADVDTWRNCYLENNHRLWTLYNAGTITKDFLMMERFRRVLTDHGYTDSEARKLSPQLSDLYLDRLASLDRLVSGALPLLDHLRQKGYRLGVISNGFHEVQFRKMQSAGITHYFDTVVLSDDIGVNKPDRRIFDHALRKTSGIADRTLIIGDNPSTDIAGGLNAGWHAICFNQNGENESSTPQGAIEITSLSQAIELL